MFSLSLAVCFLTAEILTGMRHLPRGEVKRWHCPLQVGLGVDGLCQTGLGYL